MGEQWFGIPGVWLGDCHIYQAVKEHACPMVKAVFVQQCKGSPRFWSKVPVFCSMSGLSFAVKNKILMGASFQIRFSLSNAFSD